MKKKKYLPLYYEWMKRGEIPQAGLCNCFGDCIDEWTWIPYKRFNDFRIMFPNESQIATYWGADDTEEQGYYKKFGPLRQTIVLLMAAYNNEL